MGPAETSRASWSKNDYMEQIIHLESIQEIPGISDEIQRLKVEMARRFSG